MKQFNRRSFLMGLGAGAVLTPAAIALAETGRSWYAGPGNTEAYLARFAQTGAGVDGTIFSRYLDTDGDGTGTKDSAVNHSGAKEEYKIVPPSGTRLAIARLIVSVADGANPSADVYGNLAGALTNGIDVKTKNASGDLVDLCDGVPVKANSDWSRMCYDMQVQNFGSGDDIVQVRWTFAKSGRSVIVDGTAGEYFSVDINDNLAALSSQFFMVQGVTYT